MAKGEWVKSKFGTAYYVDSWSSDSERYLLKIECLKRSKDQWIIDVFGVESFLVLNETDPEKVKKLARVYLKQVLEKIFWTFDMKKIKIEQ